MTITKSNKSTVLYIHDMDYLLPYDAKRKGQSSALKWIKFRTDAPPSAMANAEECRGQQLYSMRRASVKARKDGFAMLGWYDEVLRIYGGQRRAALRGWLVNHAYQRATAGEVAQTVGSNVALARRSLKVLEEVGLLRSVRLPDLEAADRIDRTVTPDGYQIAPPPADDRKDKTLTPTGYQIAPPPADDPDDSQSDDAPQNAEQTAEGEVNDASGTGEADGDETLDESVDVGEAEKLTDEVRNESCSAGSGETHAGRDALQKIPETVRNRSGTRLGDERQEDRRDTETEETKQTPPPPPPKTAAAAPPQFSSLSADGNGETAEKEETADASAAPRADDTPRDDGQEDDGRRSITSNPCEAEDEQTPADAVPVLPTEADPSHANDQPKAPDQDAYAMCWHSEEFAQQVLATLYPTRHDLVLQGRRCSPPQNADEFEARELGCFQKAWGKALVGVSQVEAVRLQHRALQEAQRTLRVKCRKTRGRYWCWWFGKYMADFRRKRSGEGSGPP